MFDRYVDDGTAVQFVRDNPAVLIVHFSNCPNLTELTLKAVAHYCTHARVINLNDSNLACAVPSFQKHAGLQILDLSENMLEGSVPKFALNCLLRRLDLRRNKLNSLQDFQRFLKMPNTVEVLDLSENQIAGKFPGLLSCKNLEYLDLHGNRLNGPLPEFNQDTLKYVDLTQNDLEETHAKEAEALKERWHRSSGDIHHPYPSVRHHRRFLAKQAEKGLSTVLISKNNLAGTMHDGIRIDSTQCELQGQAKSKFLV